MSLVDWYENGTCMLDYNTSEWPGASDDCCEGGLFLAVSWPRNFGYLLVSLVLLCYVFLGVALGADVFMTSIEIITSKEKQVTVSVGGEKKLFHTQVWNGTVANLTLMALGSSAPEILLNVVDIFKENYYSGELGPSTIVGSAAFNLMVISAVCIVCLPPGESRSIAQMPVFLTTAFFSIWAYVWLLIILKVSSPDIITIPEAVITCLFLVVLIGIAYFADVHYGDAKIAAGNAASKVVGIRGRAISQGKIMDELKARKANKADAGDKTAEELAAELAEDLIPKTKGDYRRGVTAALTGRGGLVNEDGTLKAASGPRAEGGTNKTADLQMVKVDLAKDPTDEKVVHVGFTRRVVACIEGQDHTARVVVRRQGPAELLQAELTVRVQTVEEGHETAGESAKADVNFKKVDAVLTFAPGVAEMTQEIEIVDNSEVSDDVFLTVTLTDAKFGGDKDAAAGLGGAKVELGGELQFASCRVQIQDDDKNPGCFRWHTERVEVYENVGKVNLTVLRTNGLNGEVSIDYKTKDQQATAGKDYVAVEGTLTFPHGAVSRSLTIEIIDDDTFEKDETFTVVLSEPTGGATFDQATDGGSDTAVCTVVILNDDEITSKLEQVVSLLRINADNLALARDNWKEALRDAVFPHPEADAKAKFMHYLNVPWKLMFAVVPPPGLMGGWPCFFGALVMIGVQVVLISDFAGMMGCQMNLKPAVTAITFVALGTSLPDTFASMAAARGDKTADNSVGNVTGSNSVNVFLGLGLSWLIAAIYWEGQPITAEWLEKYPDIAARQMRDHGEVTGGFVVYAGDLGFSVMVFTVCAIITLGTIIYRRPYELGGDKNSAVATAVFFCFLWVLYVILSSLSSYELITPPF